MEMQSLHLTSLFLSCLFLQGDPRAASGVRAEGKLGHLQIGSTITAGLSRELHAQCSCPQLNHQEIPGGIFICHSDTHSALRVLKKPPSLRSHRALFLRAKQSSFSSCKSLLEIYNLVDSKAQLHKQQEPQKQLPPLHRRRKSNSNLCCPAGTSQSQGLLLEHFHPYVIQLN